LIFYGDVLIVEKMRAPDLVGNCTVFTLAHYEILRNSKFCAASPKILGSTLAAYFRTRRSFLQSTTTGLSSKSAGLDLLRITIQVVSASVVQKFGYTKHFLFQSELDD